MEICILLYVEDIFVSQILYVYILYLLYPFFMFLFPIFFPLIMYRDHMILSYSNAMILHSAEQVLHVRVVAVQTGMILYDEMLSPATLYSSGHHADIQSSCGNSDRALHSL